MLSHLTSIKGSEAGSGSLRHICGSGGLYHDLWWCLLPIQYYWLRHQWLSLQANSCCLAIRAGKMQFTVPCAASGDTLYQELTFYYI